MSMIRVVIPFLQGKRRFHLIKGRPWSVVEHLILAAVVEKPVTAGRLSELSKLPRQVVIESLLRLMHAGWIEISQSTEGILFRPNDQGKEASGRDELPTLQKPTTRPMNLMIDQVTGMVYRRREMPLFEKHVLEQRGNRERFVWLEARKINTSDQVRAIVSTLFDEDERFVAMEDSGERLVDRFGVAAVRDGKIEGFSPRAPEELIAIILQAAQKAESQQQIVSYSEHVERKPDADVISQARFISYSSDDLILGGKEHEELFVKTIQKCRHNLVIHSTFILQEKFNNIKQLILNAAQRGANVHILWGKSDDKKEQSTTRKAAARIRQDLKNTSLGDAIHIHQFSTKSHAKIIIADDGTPNRHFAVVGSCNWLYSGFQSFEASVRVRDPLLCAEVIDQLSELSRAEDGHWTALTNYFARLAFDVRREASPVGGRAEAKLILGHEHSFYMRMARDKAASRIVVTSHRIGSAARAAVLVPAMAAARNRPIDIKIYFGLPAQEGDGVRAADMTFEAAGAGIRIEPIYQPKVHAKMLAWDNDFVVISSQNWLSADPSESNPRREMGLFIHSPGAGRRVIERFQFECNAS
jgi:phosphatidylserine/phosphatidylglycerophosphate/cardiolipin synthase-like enzyme